MIASRPDGSVELTVRRGSTNRSTLVRLATHRQGWLLCNEGARQASSTAVVTSLPSAIISVIVPNLPLAWHDPLTYEHLTPESFVPSVGSLDLRATVRALFVDGMTIELSTTVGAVCS